ncbi:MAG TPA: hypothetical protein VMS96_01775 [Terriglobales bacterium]|nr:hypothetical protein [Terriglobales bacterium]
MRDHRFPGPRGGASWRVRLIGCLVVLLYAVSMLGVLRVLAQESKPATPPPPAVPGGLQDLVREQFGECFKVSMERTTIGVKYLHPQAGLPWRPFLAADLDGDGVEDAVIVARCATPMADAGGYEYKVVDPYFANYGYGDPRITGQFNASDPNRQNLILIIHGEGKEAWRASKPKAKFVVINAPFDSLNLTKVARKKGVIVPAISLVETEGLVSSLFWDGKKWHWQEATNTQ